MRSVGKLKAVLLGLGRTFIKASNTPEIYRSIMEAHVVNVSSDIIAKAHTKNDKE